MAARSDPADGGVGAVDGRVAELAARQHGAIARCQLLALGLTRHQVQQGLARRRLHPLHLGVYAVGHRHLTRHGRWMAAVLACGDGALLSHRSAGALWEIVSREGARIDVTVVRGRCGKRPGVAVHRTRELRDADRTSRFGIPLTSPSRTPHRSRGRSRSRSSSRGSRDRGPARASRHRSAHIPLRTQWPPGHRSASIAARPLPARSWLERRYLLLCGNAGLPRPAVNVVIEGFEVDCFWPTERVVVELDGYGHHRGPEQFEADRRRDVTLQLAGLVVLRFTHRRLVDDPQGVLAETRAALTWPQQSHLGPGANRA